MGRGAVKGVKGSWSGRGGRRKLSCSGRCSLPYGKRITVSYRVSSAPWLHLTLMKRCE